MASCFFFCGTSNGTWVVSPKSNGGAADALLKLGRQLSSTARAAHCIRFRGVCQTTKRDPFTYHSSPSNPASHENLESAVRKPAPVPPTHTPYLQPTPLTSVAHIPNPFTLLNIRNHPFRKNSLHRWGIGAQQAASGKKRDVLFDHATGGVIADARASSRSVGTSSPSVPV